jgi:hypothetical protein
MSWHTSTAVGRSRVPAGYGLGGPRRALALNIRVESALEPAPQCHSSGPMARLASSVWLMTWRSSSARCRLPSAPSAPDEGARRGRHDRREALREHPIDAGSPASPVAAENVTAVASKLTIATAVAADADIANWSSVPPLGLVVIGLGRLRVSARRSLARSILGRCVVGGAGGGLDRRGLVSGHRGAGFGRGR